MRGLHFKLLMSVAVGLAVGTFSVFSQPINLISPTNSVWKFYTNSAGYNVNPGFDTTWKTNAFDDSAWPTGKGLFGNDSGYGYGFNTPIPGPSGGGPITVYYRIHFNWAGSLTGVFLSGTNYVDDGDVVYLNGVEITRFTMSPGDPTWDTLAPATVTEPIRIPMDIPLDSLTNGNANPLLIGDNVLSVEVHNQAPGSSDHVFGMSLYASQQVCPSTDGIQPADRTVVERSSSTLTVNASGIPAPTYQWHRDVGAGDEVIAGATAASYTITNMTAAQAGTYFVRVQNTCAAPVDSRHATISYLADTTAPRLVYALCGPNADEVIVRLSEPLDDTRPDAVHDAFLWKINTVGGPGGPLMVDVVTYTNGDMNIYYKLSGALDSSSSYQIVTDEVFYDTSVAANPLPLGSSVLVSCYSNKTLVYLASVWKYDDAGVSRDGSGWETAAYNDTAWKTGVAVFDGKTGTVPACRATVSGITVNTCLNVDAPRISSAYFRQKFTATAADLTNVLRLVTTLDDGAIFYLNGTELDRIGAADSTLFGSTATDYATFIGGTAVGDANYLTNYVQPGSSMVVGENTIAAMVKQVNGTSSDLSFGVQVTSISVAPPPIAPTLSIAYVGSDLQITWLPASGVLQSKNSITGTWADVTPAPAAGGPYIVPVVGAANFYSLRQ